MNVDYCPDGFFFARRMIEIDTANGTRRHTVVSIGINFVNSDVSILCRLADDYKND
jgi:hypothetical protein